MVDGIKLAGFILAVLIMLPLIAGLAACIEPINMEEVS